MKKGCIILTWVIMLVIFSNKVEAIVTSGLVSWWKFDEGTGSVAYDDPTYGSGNNGIISGASWTSGEIGNALDFDGVNDYVNVSDDNSLDVTNEATWELWIYPHKVDSHHYGLISKRAAYQNQEAYDLWIHDSNKIHIQLSNNGTDTVQMTGNITPVINEWQHVAVTYKNGETKFYYNGVFDVTRTSFTGPIYVSAQDLQIGKVNTFEFDGLIDEVRIYNRALTANEILENYGIIPEPSVLLLLGAGLLNLLVFSGKIVRQI